MYEVLIEKFDNEARGIGYINNTIIFVPNTVVGDVVKVKIVKSKKKFLIGEVVEFIKYSDIRIKPVCKYFSSCGGCDLQYISYEEQLKYKNNKIKEIMYKYANVEKEKIANISYINDNNFYYRNKITLQVKKSIGLYSKNSYDLVCIDKCFIVNNRINEVIDYIKNNIDLDKINKITIRTSEYNSNVMVIFYVDNFDENKLLKIKDKVDSIYVFDTSYKCIYGNKYIEEKIGNYIFNISPDSFFQVNSKMCKLLYDKIVEYSDFNGNENVLDLYCGTGTIGIYVSSFVNSVIGYEINKYAIEDAKINSIKNNVNNISFYCASSEESFNKINEVDEVIVDPPRSGLNDKTINGIINLKPKKIVYVSCDPMTLARDLKILGENYDIKEITPFDMFPNTMHCECVTLLERIDI